MTSTSADQSASYAANAMHGSPFHYSDEFSQESILQLMATDAALQGSLFPPMTDTSVFSTSSPSAYQSLFSPSTSYSRSWDNGRDEDRSMQSSNHDWSIEGSHLQTNNVAGCFTSASPSTSYSSRLLSSDLSFEDSHLDSPHYSPSQIDPSLPGIGTSASSSSPKSILSLQDDLSMSNDLSTLQGGAEGDRAQAGHDEEKKKHLRRQGVTCDQCRSKHLRCVDGKKVDKVGEKTRCERCHVKGLDCHRSYAQPSRRYPRPSRTGKRIEQARQIHGTLAMERRHLSPQVLLRLQSELASVSPSLDTLLTNRVMAGSVSLRLLTCFFATAHMQMPIVDFHNFSARYNFSRGDCRVMAVMANGGDPEQSIPSAKQSAPGLSSTCSPFGASAVQSRQKSTLATPESSEALIAVMHAWAALYTDMPVAFGGDVRDHPEFQFPGQSGGNCLTGTRRSLANSSCEVKRKPSDPVVGAAGNVRRTKRKQGVACDTCRLRRLRCDKLERFEGMSCSRCEDKRINCTDEYIQSQRRKGEKKGKECSREGEEEEGEEGEEGVVGSAPSLAKTVYSTEQILSEASLEQKSWAQQSASMHSDIRLDDGRRWTVYGKARQPFFQALVQKATEVVSKYRLMEEPSVEGIQALMLLAQVLELCEERGGDKFAKAATDHITALGLESNHQVDEGDQKAVEEILGNMQKRRLWCCVWTWDAIVSGLYKQKPSFKADRPLVIRGKNEIVQPGKGEAEEASNRRLDGASLGASKRRSQGTVSSGRSTELNGEMGLSFCILALMQVGALSRFSSMHINDVASSRSLLSGQCPDMDKLTKACQALWKSTDSLLLFFDQCSLKARKNMDNLQPFEPLGWIATIKLAGVMLELGTFRTLKDQVDLALRASINVDDTGTRTEEQVRQLHALKNLFAQSQKRTLTSCRKIVKLVEFLLKKNVFRMGGLILRQMLPLTQFLAMMPCEFVAVKNAPLYHAFLPKQQQQQQTNVSLSELSETSALDSDHAVDPRTLHKHTASQAWNNEKNATISEEEAESDVRKKGHVPEHIFTSQLETFDSARKRREVDICLGAMAQLGYAWPMVDDEIAKIEATMNAQGL
ncbi:hypothetical protein CBS101457_004423 [Exobasidium rhododendri]|nr:hypothetical protein CBS101457_004423 [Exobasidium rhododendri]